MDHVKLIDRTGERFGRLVVLGRMVGPLPRGGPYVYWACRCDCGRLTFVIAGNLSRGGSQSCGCLISHSVAASNVRRIKGEYPLYGTVHVKIGRLRGPARLFWCTLCHSRADEWAYDGKDPKEIQGEVGGYLVQYSLDIMHYAPLCVPCHRRHDMKKRRAK